jgi:hypothetical protein
LPIENQQGLFEDIAAEKGLKSELGQLGLDHGDTINQVELAISKNNRDPRVVLVALVRACAGRRRADMGDSRRHKTQLFITLESTTGPEAPVSTRADTNTASGTGRPACSSASRRGALRRMPTRTIGPSA